ncbi:conserved membrane hypothetical protein [metagenome]|uniref:Bax inhibitor-1/YccA family protein n=1 Tax=metagenome TaxID=256318 RepID=A0A2P2BZH0_9ZZZZ
MQSNNPVFRNAEGFNGKAPANATATYPGMTDPSTWGTGTPGAPVDTRGTGRMTIDSVVQKTAISLVVVIAAAIATWLYIGDIATGEPLGDQDNLAQLSTALLVGSGGAFVLSLFISFRRVISPALVLVFAVLEGVALGAISKAFETQFGDGIVMQAVVGTFAAFAGTLAAYKFFNIQVSTRFRTFVVAAMFGMVALGLLELVLSLFGNAIGFYGFGGLGLVFAIAGLALGVFMLILDFDFVERGVAAGLEEKESWRAAFGITVSLVWIYTNLLRILAIMRN